MFHTLSPALSRSFRMLLLLVCGLLPVLVLAAVPKDHAVMITATVQKAPPQINLAWPKDTTITGYQVFRKAFTATAWGTAIATPDTNSTGYADTNVTVGTRYEYEVVGARTGSVTAYGYLLSGIEAPLTEARGKLILLVDNTMATPLAAELTRLIQDLVGDGWTVLRHDVARTATPPDVKAIIKADYTADPTGVKTLFIFGHVPIAKSGYMAPDGHAARPWPADSYYGDMDGNWTDTTTGTGYTPGDGIFDQVNIPSPLELQTGRVDLFNMTVFAPKTETDLLRQYLNKDHTYRTNGMVTQAKAFIDDNFGEFSGEAFAQSGWRLSPILGDTNVDAGDWLAKPDIPYIWGYGDGGGNYQGAGGVASTSDLVTNDPAVFTMLFGSYFGEWNSDNNFLRAPLACANYGLTCSWAGRPNWFYHSMAMGEPIGVSALLSANNTYSLYQPNNYGTLMVHVALMGDPTLRQYPITPAADLTSTLDGNGGVDLGWTASPDSAVIGYHIYRGTDPAGPFTRISSDPVSGVTFHDGAPLAHTNYYMVRAVKLQTSPSGSFYDASQGVFTNIDAPIPAYLPDAQIRAAGETDYLGADIYLPVVDATQTKTQQVDTNVTAVYELRLQNNGTATDSFTVTGPAGGNGWTVKFFDALVGGNEVTGDITGSGWTTPEMGPGVAVSMRVELSGDATRFDGDALNVPVTIISTNAPFRQDVATARLVLKMSPVATPVFTPPAGTYVGSVTVAIACDTPGADIRYTLDGTTPTRQSAPYTDPLIFTGYICLKARAFKAGMADAPVVTGYYYLKAFAPVFTPAPGIYHAPVSVAISSATPNMYLYYTTDGSTPSSYRGSPLYSAPLLLDTYTYLQAIASGTASIKPGLEGDNGATGGGTVQDSAVTYGEYFFVTATPVITPAPGIYYGAVTVTITCETPDAEIRFTRDGSDPTTDSELYTGALTLTDNTQLVVRAFRAGMDDSDSATANYTVMQTVLTPTVDPAPGAYTAPVAVTLGCATPDAAIYYTLDGTAPTSASPRYTASFTLRKPTTVKAIGVKDGLLPSDIAAAAYAIATAAPTLNPAPGTYQESIIVTLTCATPNAIIHYTLDGTTPTAASTIYTVPFALAKTTTVKAIAVRSDMDTSPLATGVYVLQVAAPVVLQAPGTYLGVVRLNFSCTTPDAVIRYTLDGSDPTPLSHKFGGTFDLTQSASLKLRAFKDGLLASELVGAAYTITPLPVSAPVFEPAPGAFLNAVKVVIFCATPGAAIHYTVNGADPTALSPLYAGPLTFAGNTTLKAIAVKAGMLDSPVTSGIYQLTGDNYEPDNTGAQAKYIANGQTQSRSINTPTDVDWVKFALTEPSDVRIETNGPTGDTVMWLYGPNSSTREVAYNDDNGVDAFSLIALTGAQALPAGMYYIKVQSLGQRSIIPAYTLTLQTTAAGQVATPILAPRTGVYQKSVTVTLSCPTPGAEIHYTTDGREPTSASPRYTGPLTFTVNTQLKAAAFKAGLRANIAAVEKYLVTP